MKARKKVTQGLLFSVLLIIAAATPVGSEEVTITTYYPAPYGEYLELYVSDKVGIGIMAPEAILQVHGADGAAGNIVISGTRNPSDNLTLNAIQFKAPNSDTNPERRDFVLVQLEGGVGGQTALAIKSLTSTGSWGAELLRITNDGNVGIGTSTPDAKLHIQNGFIKITDSSSTRYGLLRRTNGAGGNFHIDAYGGNYIYLSWFGGGGVRVGNGAAGWGPIWASVFNIASSLEFKQDITSVSDEEISQTLNKLKTIELSRYRFKGEKKTDKLHFGLLTENAPEEILSEDKKFISFGDAIGYLFAIAKAQQQEIESLKSGSLRMLSNGNVSIGMANPGDYKLYVNDSAYATGGLE